MTFIEFRRIQNVSEKRHNRTRVGSGIPRKRRGLMYCPGDRYCFLHDKIDMRVGNDKSHTTDDDDDSGK